MVKAVLIFPNQLFEKFPIKLKNKKVFLIEDRRFFTDFIFHKQKIILHRASMKFYFDFLIGHGIDVNYIEFNENWFDLLNKLNADELHVIDVVDFKLKDLIEKFDRKIIWYENPSFLISGIDGINFFKDKNHYSQTSFYIYQRKNFKILVDKNNKPIGEKWSFDKENREKLPVNIEVPSLNFYIENQYIKEAKKYASENFPDNYGDDTDFIYPISFEDVRNRLDNFCKYKLTSFGPYQDSISENNSFLFHSVLSYALNIGLITPSEILNTILKYAKKYNPPINSFEGFIRQIIGWREFVRIVYLMKGKEQFESNFFSHQRKLPAGFYSANTGIYPVDNILSRVLKYSYANHIERLMVLGNFCLLCEVNPKIVYKWFMEMLIDAYEWVMIPNIFGMSQYADGGLIVTKPYFSSSNYILRMSDYKKDDWCEIFDSLYWRFVFKNKEIFNSNPRLKIMSLYLNNMNKEKLKGYIHKADNFL